ncbi:MAG: hypothetical protein FWC46_09220 [Actinomycetia bacterium]|nr:hypothetical protein [Actinomycetes bacterium]
MDVELSPRDAEAARHVLGMVVPGQAMRVWTLTDEQILVLDDPEQPQLVTQPWLPGRVGDPPNAEMLVLAQEVALRGLVARGDVETVVSDSQIAEVTARPEITGCLVLRRLGNALLRVARATSQDATVAYFYRQDEGPILEEVVDENGLHAFAVYEPTVWGPRLADFLDPAQGAGRGAIDETGPASRFAENVGDRPELSQALAASSMTAVLRDVPTPKVATIFSSEAGTYWLRETAVRPEEMRLTGISRAELEALGPSLTAA